MTIGRVGHDGGSTDDPPLSGRTAPRFAPVRDAFADLLATGVETGAALTVVHEGRVVVELYGGWRDTGRTREWTADTLVNTFSVGKPVVALCLLHLVDRGRVGLDEPVARYWPGFRTPATVRQVLSHTAGLPVFPVARTADDLADWDLLTGDLAGAEADWPPGSSAAEHALTYGHLVGELVRRVDGRTPGRYLAEEIAGPWRLDLGFGLDAAARRRCAELEYGEPGWAARILGDPAGLRARAVGNPAGCLDLSVVNGAEWRGSEFPAVGLHATATGVARCYAGLLAGGVLDGVRLFSADTVAEAVTAQYAGPDQLLARPVRWTLGMQLDDDGSWGMSGIGGSCGYADPVRGYAFGYVTRYLAGFGPRVNRLADLVNDITGGQDTAES